MDLKEMFSKMVSGEVAAHSELGTRDESKQMRSYTARIRRLRLTTDIRAHALVMKDVVIKFNPFTGEADDTYNEKTPYRPILLVSQVIEGIKNVCAANPELAAKWNKVLKTDIIDWAAPVCREDYLAFKHADMIKMRVMTYPTVSLNFDGINGFPQFRQKYLVDGANLDASYNYPPEDTPVWQKAAAFFNRMLRAEADEKKTELEANAASKETVQNTRRTIFSKSPVSFVGPTNLVPFLYIPLHETLTEFDPDQYSSFEACIRYTSRNQEKWNSASQDVMSDDEMDDNMDFFDFVIRTPSSSDRQTNGKVYTDQDNLALWQAMSITVCHARYSIWTGKTTTKDKTTVDNSKAYAFLWQAAYAYFAHSQEESFKPDGESFERLMAASNGFRPITTVLEKLPSACNQVFLAQFANSKYFTEDVKRANHDFFVLMNPSNALAIADADEEELDAAAKAQAQSLSAIMNAANEAFSDADDVEDLVLVEDGADQPTDSGSKTQQ